MTSAITSFRTAAAVSSRTLNNFLPAREERSDTNMDGGGAKKGAVNFQRRAWDKSEYEDRAKERSEKEALGEDELDILPDGRKAPAPYRAAPEGLKRVAGSERAYVQARTDELHLDAKLHKKQAR